MALYQELIPTKTHAITPSDATDLAALGIKMIYVGGAGNVAVRFVEDAAAVTLTAPPVGTFIRGAFSRVMSTNTTATAIVGFS